MNRNWSDFFNIGVVTVNWNLIWTTRCYYAWIWRNQEEHGEKAHRLFNPGAFLVNKVKEYEQAVKLMQVGMEKVRTIKSFAWLPPQND